MAPRFKQKCDFFRSFSRVLERCVIRASKAWANILGYFYENNIWRHNFQISGGGTLFPFPITCTYPTAGTHVWKMTHCVSEFRDYVSEGGPDAFRVFWRRFSSTEFYWTVSKNSDTYPGRPRIRIRIYGDVSALVGVQSIPSIFRPMEVLYCCHGVGGGAIRSKLPKKHRDGLR